MEWIMGVEVKKRKGAGIGSLPAAAWSGARKEGRGERTC
jgi:hypothetical protein